ncbi:MAG: glycosyltransferase family 2 protein [Bryobacterales bacterium]|nr:glycosyltransferase family 2 protein [Bryobacterales bacterium]
MIPTLHAGTPLAECIGSLLVQSRPDFEIVVVDNSGTGLVRRHGVPKQVRVIENTANRGYGGGVNQAAAESGAPYIAALNDDAVVSKHWLDSLVRGMESDSRVGMCASQVILAGEGVIDSAGMLLCPDGSSRQRGHRRKPEEFAEGGEVFFPSGSAALYRRELFTENGGFDEDFFLYCEDTDLGLRARWAGWKCLYVPAARVFHHYSRTAGRVSSMKAYYVERNRLYVMRKNFPAGMRRRAWLAALARYFWHARYLGRPSSAGDFLREGNSFFAAVKLLVRAWAEYWGQRPMLDRKRAQTMQSARISAAEFEQLCQRFVISPRQVAAL